MKELKEVGELRYQDKERLGKNEADRLAETRRPGALWLCSEPEFNSKWVALSRRWYDLIILFKKLCPLMYLLYSVQWDKDVNRETS